MVLVVVVAAAEGGNTGAAAASAANGLNKEGNAGIGVEAARATGVVAHSDALPPSVVAWMAFAVALVEVVGVVVLLFANTEVSSDAVVTLSAIRAGACPVPGKKYDDCMDGDGA